MKCLGRGTEISNSNEGISHISQYLIGNPNYLEPLFVTLTLAYFTSGWVNWIKGHYFITFYENEAQSDEKTKRA